jgi:uncharacterized protein (DUF433 family)
VHFTRITVNPAQMGGVPCIRGHRIPVATVIGMIADGMTPDEVTAELPDLRREDVSEALRFAAEAVRERQLQASGPTAEDSGFAAELIAMGREQKALLERTGAGSVGPVPVEVRRERRELFVRHADRLKALLDRHGWPRPGRDGEQAVRAEGPRTW